MELRYLLAVVVAGGGTPGRDVAVALGRAGAGVLVTDGDAGAAARTAELVEACRTRAWWLQADHTDGTDAALLAARARDLGGADLLVTAVPAADASAADAAAGLADVVVEEATARPGRRAGTPAVVHLGDGAPDLLAARVAAPGGRETALAPGSGAGPAVGRAVLDLLARGVGGEVRRL